MNFLKNGQRTVALLFLGVVLISCDSSNSTPDPEPDAILINSEIVDGFTVDLFSETSLITGENTLYWRITQDDEAVDIQTFEIMPMMDMGMMQHSTPYTQPVESLEYPGYFVSEAAFIMPSGEMGDWDISFDIQTQNNTQISGNINIDVESSWHLTGINSTSGDRYFISWKTPKEPVSGSNDISFMLYKRETMMSFPKVMDAQIEIYPYMDMGSGQGHSTAFENPSMTEDGVYKGNITYNMSGVWTTSVTITTSDDESLPEVVFEYHVRAQ